jgi:hypothetical protein
MLQGALRPSFHVERTEAVCALAPEINFPATERAPVLVAAPRVGRANYDEENWTPEDEDLLPGELRWCNQPEAETEEEAAQARKIGRMIGQEIKWGLLAAAKEPEVTWIDAGLGAA